MSRDAAAVEAGAAGSTDAVRTLFDRVAALQTTIAPLAALTIYDADGVPLAWEGRPASLPASRLSGGSATFLVPTPLGLRLARLEPVAGVDSGRRRVGVVVAEAALSSGVGPSQSAAAVEVDTPFAPVMLGPSAGVSSDPAAVDLVAPDGTMLGTARVSADGSRGGTCALVGPGDGAAVGAGGDRPGADDRPAGRLAGDGADTRTVSRACRRWPPVALSGAWWSAHRALRAAAGDDAAAIGFLITALFAVALVWLAWTTTGRWRIARRRQHGARPRIAVGAISSMPGSAPVSALPSPTTTCW